MGTHRIVNHSKEAHYSNTFASPGAKTSPETRRNNSKIPIKSKVCQRRLRVFDFDINWPANWRRSRHGGIVSGVTASIITVSYQVLVLEIYV